MFYIENNALYRRFDEELLCIEPWGNDSFRIRATMMGEILDFEYSALSMEVEKAAEIVIDGMRATIRNGKARCEVLPSGKMRFYNQHGQMVLEEYDRNRFREEDEGFNSALELDPRTFIPHRGTNHFKLKVRFEAHEEERLYGMGQYQQPFLNLKGCIVELAQRNSQASVPFLLSNKGYGLLWNNPGIGSVTFGRNMTQWEAKSTKQLDYWITIGDTPAEIEESYAKVTGTVPMMPEYGTGFWQCKLRYQTQEELMEIAREYKRRNLPISVIVCDYFHWPYQGDWKFDLDYWPDPEGMVKELKEMGIELMVSIWPTVEKGSENYHELKELGMLTRNEAGSRMTQLGEACFIDVTNPKTRDYVWDKMKKNYYEKGIKIFWLDEAEPEFTDYEFDQYRYLLGADLEVGNSYPKYYSQMAYEGMEKEGQENILNLVRCAWAGSQKYGALVWSGDIDSSFLSLRNQLAAGLNMGIAGIPWWTTDIGGFHGGHIESEEFKECLVRWFQFGAFCPVFRLHGDREPHQKPLSNTGGGRTPSGADNEVWTYGEEVYEICKKYMELREQMRPYITGLMKAAHEKGSPVMRPLFYDFPEDKHSWLIEDEYMFGDKVLVCPILYEEQRQREVYLPYGEMWEDIHTGKVYEGGQSIEVKADISTIPVFVKQGYREEVFAIFP
ncbi:glycoside hydrolase family 31 protein [Kineothrix sp. MB12-C1]|uniref:glycoside hydrolase family 31 protein n=1 Tax=Kineothrix sp. MB12-C1 TaxID=3070215 RepID=UPI0027D25F1C|nr:TIM-barrel domain-containing protein [Kineothrix sp. MB12-C1]WMC93993.1 glycoside hydrolase family 31 protein [Kineothrix sp. MB12-C1]